MGLNSEILQRRERLAAAVAHDRRAVLLAVEPGRLRPEAHVARVPAAERADRAAKLAAHIPSATLRYAAFDAVADDLRDAGGGE